MKPYLKLLLIAVMFIGCGKRNPSHSYQKKDYKQHISEAKDFIEQHNLSREMMILVDLSIHSGKNRMFVIDPKTEKLLYSTLTTHGTGRNGNYSTEGNIQYSNQPDSYCSSKGKYILGKNRVYSPGYQYKYIMYGQEATNSNAMVRNVVFHPWRAVPNEETYPQSISGGWGCPAVSEQAFEHIHQMIQSTDKRVLLWIL